MSLIACNCPNCNAQLDFDDNREIMFCNYCGTKVLREKISNCNFNSSVIEQKIKNAYTKMSLGLYEDARRDFDVVKDEAPGDYRGWMGYIEADIMGHIETYNKYCIKCEYEFPPYTYEMSSLYDHDICYYAHLDHYYDDTSIFHKLAPQNAIEYLDNVVNKYIEQAIENGYRNISYKAFWQASADFAFVSKVVPNDYRGWMGIIENEIEKREFYVKREIDILKKHGIVTLRENEKRICRHTFDIDHVWNKKILANFRETAPKDKIEYIYARIRENQYFPRTELARV